MTVKVKYDTEINLLQLQPRSFKERMFYYIGGFGQFEP